MKKKDLPEIIFENENYLAVNKPAGWLTIPDRYFSGAPCLKFILEEHYERLFVVHRIDRDTSGSVIFAKNRPAHRALNEAFSNHDVNKIYHAILRGALRKEELEIDIPLLPNPYKGGGVIPSARGKYSLTMLKILKKFRMATFAECRLVTGRQHQIRAHAAAIGHPLLVDGKYGESDEFFLSSIKRRYNVGKNEAERPIINRLTLHSRLLEFDCPLTGRKISCESEYPKDFRVTLQLLEKYAGLQEYLS